MFGIGFTELIVVLVVALIVIGPDKLPAIAKTMGKAFVEFRRVGEDLKKTITDIDLKGTIEDIDLNAPAARKQAAPKKRTASKKKGHAPGSSPESGIKPDSQPDKKVT